MKFTKKHEDMMSRFQKSGMYLVTSQNLSQGRTTIDIVKATIAGGVRLFQLREKNLALSELVPLAEQVRRLTQEADALLIINDRLDVALAVGADGVHLGQEDFPISAARRLAPDMIIGASIHSVPQAQAAESAGASYVNIGPLFSTQTKAWQGDFLGIEAIPTISRAIAIPFTVMGGIKKKHIPHLLKAGARTIAVVTAVTAADDPERSARDILSRISQHIS